MIYKSKRFFRIWGYTASHSSLLLRSNMLYSDDKDYSLENSFNIDIEIWDVAYIGIPVFINNMEIKEITLDSLPLYIDKNLCEFDRKIFEFISDIKNIILYQEGY